MYQKVIDLIYGKTPWQKTFELKQGAVPSVSTWMARSEGAVPASYITPILIVF